MMHSDPDVLAAVAMGEADVAAADIRHIDTCDACARESSSLRRVAELARTGPAEEPLLTPADAVWSRISATLGFSDDLVPTMLGATVAGEIAPVADLRRHRLRRPRRRWVLPVAAAASVALIAGVAGAFMLAQRPAATVLADVSLDALPQWEGSSGDARIERAGDGQRDVVVTLTASEPTSDDRFREVWLLSADLTKLVSVGVLAGDSGSFDIPDGIDLADYPIVDVSEEQLDGDPTHSGDSIVRGEITS